MIIDIHAHIWQNQYEINKKEIIDACNHYGISKVYVSGLGGYYPDQQEINDLNQKVYQFMREYPDLVGGFCYINPRNDDSLDVLKQNIEERGMAGLKLWVATFCDDPLVDPLIEKCIDYNMPILTHAFVKTVGQLAYESTGINVCNLAKRYPEAKIIMAHLGGNSYHGIKAIRNCKNVWVDYSGSIFRRDDIDYTLKQIGAKRILFGTDMPGSYLLNLGGILEADLSEYEKELIFYRNALKLFDKVQQ